MISPLSAKGFDPNDQYFVYGLAEQVAEEVVIEDMPDSIERLKALPEHWRYLEPLLFYQSQAGFWGHREYFRSSPDGHRQLVAEGLAYYQADAFAENYAEALRTCRSMQDAAGHERSPEQENPYREQDARLSELRPGLVEIVTAVVRRNLAQYE